MAILVRTSNDKDDEKQADDVTVAEESYGKNATTRYKKCTRNNSVSAVGSKAKNVLPSARHFFKTVFLPQGYPDSVSEDYLRYQIWDTSQAFCSSITGVLATQAMLKGYGVGNQNATALAATMTWMLKDGTGMVGRILFAWAKGSQLDCDAKRFRFLADVLNDMAIFLELVASVFPSWFMIIACLSSLLKSIVGVAGGATRAALTQHQARRDNMADVSAKDGSQETLVNLLALVTGLIVTPLVANNTSLVWFLFFFFTYFHLYSNYKAVTSVIMETVNLSRCHILTMSFMQTGDTPTPKEVASVDPVLTCPGYFIIPEFGVRFNKAVCNIGDLEEASLCTPGEKFLMKLKVQHKRGFVAVVLHCDATERDIFASGFHAMLIDLLFQDRLLPDMVWLSAHSQVVAILRDWQAMRASGNQIAPYGLVAMAHKISIELFPLFMTKLEAAGWDLDRARFATDEWRSVWRLPADVDKKSN